MSVVLDPSSRAVARAEPVADLVATVCAWWERRAAHAGLEPSWCRWSRSLGSLPVDRGTVLPELLDASPTELGNAYLASLDGRTRLREGRHYTPVALATQLWAEVEWTEGRIVDPACGTGALLLPAVQAAVRSAQTPVDALAAVDRLHGTDLDPVAVWIGNAVLKAELLATWARIRPEERSALPSLLAVGDGLARSDERVGAVLMNPPYGRITLRPNERARWQASVYGHANRYALFIHAAVERTVRNGVVAALVPTSFVGGAYFQRLRSFLEGRAPLAKIAFVDSRSGVFSDVLQETCIAVFRVGAKSGPVPCERLSVNGIAAVERLGSAPAPSGAGRPWFLPRKVADGSLVSSVGRLEHRLADYGWRASTGPLVWNRHKPQISQRRRPGSVPILWASDIEDSSIRRSVLRESLRWIALRPQDDFMRLEEQAILVQRTTAPEQPRRLVVARLDDETLDAWGGTVVVENHVNVLRCTHSAGPLDPRLLERLLQTPTFDRLYRCVTGSVAVSAYELESLPLPGPAALRCWNELSFSELVAAVADYYGDAAS